MSIRQYLDQLESLKPSDSQNGGSKKAGLLLDEVLSAGKKYKDRIAEVRSIGGKPEACPPEHFTLTGDDLLPRLRALSPAEQDLDISVGVAKVIREIYPCR